jgi:hypothetical protein
MGRVKDYFLHKDSGLAVGQIRDLLYMRLESQRDLLQNEAADIEDESFRRGVTMSIESEITFLQTVLDVMERSL